MTNTAPLLGTRDLDSILAWRHGQPVLVRQFVADAQVAAAQLPADAQGVVALCPDRYDFAVLMAAALLRGLPTLMPPNALPATLTGLRREHAGLVTIDALLVRASQAQTAAVRDIPSIRCDLQAAILLTSGSTGVPVPHGRSWGSVVLNAQAQAERMAEALGRDNLVGLTLVATVPAQHSYGFESSLTLALIGGAAFDHARPFYPADIAQALKQAPRPRALVTTPFHLKTLLAADIELPTVDVIFSATAPLSPQLAALAEQALGGPVLEVYGCTEAGQVATRHTTRSPTWTTYGDLRITRRSATEGEADDCFWVQGGHVLVPTPLADVLELDDAQHFRLLGRRGDLIHVAGKRSSLAHLNHHLNSIEGVVDGAFWMPEDDQAGGVVRPVAFVVAPSLSAQAISSALQQRLDTVFVPRRIIMLSTIPREDTGKVTAATLRALAQAHGVG